MNKRQQLLILSILSKLAMTGTFYFGFWTFIYQFAWSNKAWWYALMSSAVSLVLAVLCFMGWVVLEMWSKDPSTIPKFKIERATKKEEQGEAEGDDKKKKKPQERLPLF